MAMRIHQREIVELPFSLPNGQILTHMGLVLSREELQDYEDGMFYAVLISSKNHYPELTLEINPEWLSKPLSKNSYFITHIVSQFNAEDVIHRYNNFLKSQYFDDVIDKIVESIVGNE